MIQYQHQPHSSADWIPWIPSPDRTQRRTLIDHQLTVKPRAFAAPGGWVAVACWDLALVLEIHYFNGAQEC